MFVTVGALAQSTGSSVPSSGSGSESYGSGSSGSGSSGSGSSESGSSGSQSSGSQSSGTQSSGSDGSGNGSSSSESSSTGLSAPSSQPSSPITPLQPSVHWDTDTSDIANLVPGNNTSLYYSSDGIAGRFHQTLPFYFTNVLSTDPAVQHLFAQLSTNFSYPSVVLEHSDYVQSITIEGNALLITFTNASVYDYAEQAWSSVPSFVLVTYTEGVGNSTEQRTFWLVQGLSSGTTPNSILVQVEELAIEDAVGGIDMVWGTYTPANGTSSGTSSSGGAGTTNAGIYGNTSPGNGTLSGSNSTYTNTSGTCGAPPSATIDGFPAAACGATDFDELLDNAIGYLNFSSADLSSTLKDFAPGLTDDDPSDYEDEPSSKIRRRMLVQSRRLHRRGWFSSILKKVASTVTSAAKSIVHTVVQVRGLEIRIILR